MSRAKEILPKMLYMAANPAKWAGREEKLRWIRSNVKHVVVLANLDDPDLREMHAAGEIDYLHLPVKDGHRSLDSRLYDVAKTIAAWLKSEEPTLVCCLVGRSRSGAACALTVREMYNVTGSDALDYVRSKRPGAVKRYGPEQELRSLSRPRVSRPRKVLPR